MPLDICRARLAGQFLTTSGPASAASLVEALGAVQAQDYRGAKWGLALRLTNVTDATIERDIDAGRILRTHILRPTWHFVAPADIRWMLDLTAPRVKAKIAPIERRLGLDAAVLRRSRAVFEKVLGGGRSLTRSELGERLRRARIPVGAGQPFNHLLMALELEGVLVSGPRRGKQSTYALLEERAPGARRLSPDESLLELARRYFTTHGPATPHDFAWWSGLTVRDARRAIDLNDSALARVTLGDTDYWTGAAAPAPPRSRSAHLLPNYDEYFIGHRDRSAIGARLRDLSIVMGGNALIPHVIVVDGQLVGTWKRSAGKKGLVVELSALARLTTAESARVLAAARRLETFHERPVDVRLR